MINHLFRQWVALLATAALAFAGLVAVLPTASADAAAHLPDITAAHHDGNRYVFDAGAAKLRVTVEDADLLRVEVAPDGTFTDPANDTPSDPTAPMASPTPPSTAST